MRRWAVGVLAVALWACGGGDASDVATEQAGDGGFCGAVLAQVDSFTAAAERRHPVPDDPHYGGTAVVGGIGEIAAGMNALVSADYAAVQHQKFANLMTLIRYDRDFRPAPWLATSWDVAPDHGSVTFHLRDDVYWHDGVRTSAYDVAFTYERATDPETGFPNAAFWDFYVKGAQGVEVSDSFTVTLHMQPHAEFLDAWRALAILPEHLLGDVPAAELRDHPYGSQCPVGNGPFVFVSHRPQESWTFRANPAFPEALGGRPYLDRYVYRIVPEPSTLLGALLTGDLDVYIAPSADQAQAIGDDPDVELRHYPFRSYVFIGWNSRRPQLADRRVRTALTVGTNRQEIVQALLYGYGRVANTGVPPFHWAYDPALEDTLGFDPDEARRLLDEAGWMDRDGDGVRENAEGVPLSISLKYNAGNTQRQGIAEVMQAQLADIGVDIRPESVEFQTLVGQITNPEDRDFDGVVMSWVPEFKVDDTDLFHSERADQPYGWAGTHDPELDRLLDTLQLVVDRDEARPLWRAYQRELIREQPYTFFYFQDRLDGVSTRLRDVVMDARGEWVNLKDWWIPPDERRSPAP